MIDLLNSDALRIPMAARKVQCIITSPPYWSLRDYQVANQIGLERVPDCLGWATGKPCGECYVCHIVAAMRECWRVLRDDGVCWLNMGDSYVTGTSADRQLGTLNFGQGTMKARQINRNGTPAGLKPKDLCMIPARVALALQADGWYLRSMIPWLKRNGMPESTTDRPTGAVEYVYLLSKSEKYYFDNEAIKMSSRGQNGSAANFARATKNADMPGQSNKSHRLNRDQTFDNGTRNRRNSDWFFESWQGLYIVDDEPAALIVNPQPYSGAHFATFPPALVEPMILAGTSARGACPHCGKAWSRVIDKPNMNDRPIRKDAKQDGERIHSGFDGYPQSAGQVYQDWRNENPNTTIGWSPACACYDVPPLPDEPDDTSNGDMAAYRVERARLLDLYATLPIVPCIVLDPFAGSGTVGKVAVKHGRRFVGCELNREYIDLALERTSKVQTVMQL